VIGKFATGVPPEEVNVAVPSCSTLTPSEVSVPAEVR
jgi:hypothetical protein